MTRNAPQKSERIETGQSIFRFEFQQSRLLLYTTSIFNVMSCFHYSPSLSYNQSPYFSKHFLAWISWLDLTLSSLLHDQPVLNRKAGGRGKRLLSKWGYVCRGQTAVNFEIRALELFQISRLRVASGGGPHGCVSALIRGHCINISRCSTNMR